MRAIGPDRNKFQQGVTAIAVVRTGELLVGSGSGTLARVKPGTWKLEHSKTLDGSVTSIALRGEGHEFYAGTALSTIYKVSFADFQSEIRSVGHFERINVRGSVWLLSNS
jgi:hypothetical protein